MTNPQPFGAKLKESLETIRDQHGIPVSTLQRIAQMALSAWRTGNKDFHINVIGITPDDLEYIERLAKDRV